VAYDASISRLAASLTLLALAACGDDTEVVVDAGGADGGADALPSVAPPEIPWLEDGISPVMFTPCPEGWREVVDEDGVTTCDPYPDGEPDDCAFGEAHFVGEPNCRPIGDPCPAGDFATDLPTDGPIVHVNPAATAPGDGSLAAPYASLSEVSFTALAAGTTVALAKGTYEGTLALKAGVQVVGACVAETILTGVDAPVAAVIQVTTTGEPAGVRNVAIVGPSRNGASIRDGRSLFLEGVLIERAHGHGLYLSDPSTSATARSVVVRDTQSEAGGYGRGITVQSGARLEASDLLLLGNHESGLGIGLEGSEAVVTSAAVLDTQPLVDGSYGRGIGVQAGARFEGTEILVAHNHDTGMFIQDPDTEVVLVDAVVRDTLPRGYDDEWGRGLSVEDGASIDATRLLVTRTTDVGLFIGFEGTRATLTDTAILHTEAQRSDLNRGEAMDVQAGANLVANRLLVAHSTYLGMYVSDSDVVLNDAAVVDTRPAEVDGDYGNGIQVWEGATFRASRILISDSHNGGLLSSDLGSQVILTDAVVRNTKPRAYDSLFGMPLRAQARGRLTGERVAVEGGYEVGVFSTDDSTIELSDVSISDIRRSACECPERGFGHAVAAVSGTVRLNHFAVSDAETCGLFVGRLPLLIGTPSLDVESGVVERTSIGACIQVEPYDLDRLRRDVVYRDNEGNLESTMLPVPEPPESIAP
jgi:hypothetical protein